MASFDGCPEVFHALERNPLTTAEPCRQHPLPLSTASDARSSPLRAFSCPALASKPHGRARPLWRPSGAPAAASARGPWRGSARRPRAPGARGRILRAPLREHSLPGIFEQHQIVLTTEQPDCSPPIAPYQIVGPAQFISNVFYRFQSLDDCRSPVWQ